jgi:hypothetical protein
MTLSEGVSVLALALSGVATVISLRAQRRSAAVTTVVNATELALQMDRLFIDNPAVRPLFYEDAPRSGQDPNLVLAITEMVIDVLECIWDHRGQFSEADACSWGTWILYMFRQSRELRAFYYARPDWYPSLAGLVEGRDLQSAAGLAPPGCPEPTDRPAAG